MDNKNVEIYIDKARKCYKKEKYEETIKYLEKAIALTPDDFRIYSGIGDCYNSLNNFEKAIEYYKKAVALSDDPIFYANIGSCYVFLHRFKEAIEYLNKSILLGDEDVFPYFKRAFSLRELERYSEAISDFDTVIKFYNKNFKEYKNAYGERLYYESFFQRGTCKLLKKEYLQAIKDYNVCLEYNQYWSDCYYFKGICLYNMEYYVEAETIFKKALECFKTDELKISERNDKLYYKIGSCYKYLEQYQKSLENLNKAIEMNQFYVAARDLRLEVLKQLDKY